MILANTIAERVVIQHDTGVVVLAPTGRRYIKATRETIIACGVFESPKLLMLSGIGPQSHLLEKELNCILDSPHVEQNLQDHPVLPHVFQVKDRSSLDRFLRPGPDHDDAMQEYRE